MKTALTIAGSDSSGGAGIQADIKTMTAHKVYAMSVITAITAQNTLGVMAIENVSSDMVAKQMDAIFCDIIPHSVKIGMVSSSKIITVISDKLRQYKAKNIVIDPIITATSGSKLINNDAIKTLIDQLLPLSSIITPNLAEAELLSAMKIFSHEQMIEAAKKISKFYPGYIFIKGGHLEDDDKSTDLLFKKNEIEWFESERIVNKNLHGTGCTLSSAIAANLAIGYDMKTSVKKAKQYITNAIAANLNLGKGQGPIDHTHNIVLKG